MYFEDMFNRIEAYHGLLGQKRAYDTKLQQMQSVRNLSLAVIMEVAEMVDSLPWKPWRELDSQCEDIDNVKREIIDIIFFLVGICEDLHITGRDLEVKFEQVLSNNLERLTTGYSKVGFAEGGDNLCQKE